MLGFPTRTERGSARSVRRRRRAAWFGSFNQQEGKKRERQRHTHSKSSRVASVLQTKPKIKRKDRLEFAIWAIWAKTKPKPKLTQDSRQQTPQHTKNKQTETHPQKTCARNATGTSRLRKIPRRPRRQQSTQLPQPQSRRPRLPRRKQPLSRRQQQLLLLPLRRHQHRRQPSPKQQRPFPRIARHVQSSRTNK